MNTHNIAIPIIAIFLTILTGCSNAKSESSGDWTYSAAKATISSAENTEEKPTPSQTKTDSSKEIVLWKYDCKTKQNVPVKTYVKSSNFSPDNIFHIASNMIDNQIFQESGASFLPDSKNIKVTFDSYSVFAAYCSKHQIKDDEKRTDVYTDIPTEKAILKAIYQSLKSAYPNARICFFVGDDPITFEQSNIKSGFLFD